MSDIRFTKAGQMEPVLPRRIAKALARLRAMTEPYFDKQTADEAEHTLRVAIRDTLNHVKNERLILAKLGADEPQFSNPLHVYAAKKIRDLVLNAAATPEPR